MFGRKKDEPQSPVNVQPVEQSSESADGRKTGPTPKRSAQQANRQRPLVPTDRKAAKEAERQQRIEAQNRLRIANETGDERYLMPRDKGEQKRYTRNFIDSRWMFGEFMMFIILAFLVISLVFQSNLQIQVFVQLALWVVIALIILEAIVTSILLKRRLVAKFGHMERGVRMYAAMRGMQFRKLRLPKPQVARGAKVD
ncbi:MULTISPECIES: DUF3043 domain-containing protein [Glutamicibacter]|uniref:DUF3043 domain-containing protein n=1 Tax=Glutamicibacter halophytocola TaxID=1933880 RepID=A0A5B8I0S7_9MICC|nr:DUF3043 domain-containing protein [Glutamicibacter halophytocola]MBF6671736.1 DUF3043 domain-containing protein [Glutamicibacter sp. FBE19]ALG29029.1 hypothetical protein AOZ07_08600 [Glutamicibacter halophytocola]NQD42509.1 DUF3043 domain-containing protein [Glutamicibacter halophytocola]QDY65286.1 DUF3043 domain-containing protein [Glutamicibacter halophytocola]UUX60622.1 DUF3043 domain-containing protein [Glutamicibacter halophytocola]